ncbi:MAG: futalosine hydrolase [Thermodesulfobacteriota bacterium]
MPVLLVCATELERAPLADLLGPEILVRTLVCGVGLVDAAIGLADHLRSGPDPGLVINFGVGGAYCGAARLLDLCVATSEHLGDAAICYDDRMEPFAADAFPFFSDCRLPQAPAVRVRDLLAAAGFATVAGPFVTVNCVSGSRRRGDLLRDRFGAVCENMEGAALARVCQRRDIPFVEIRCCSNLVEDRNRSGWLLEEATRRCAEAVAVLLSGEKTASPRS